jgi:RNA exonuclease 1
MSLYLSCDSGLNVNSFAFRFSGITEEDMAGVQTSIYDVQATLLSFIYDRTILVGHSLDSDFKALKVWSYIVTADVCRWLES